VVKLEHRRRSLINEAVLYVFPPRHQFLSVAQQQTTLRKSILQGSLFCSFAWDVPQIDVSLVATKMLWIIRMRFGIAYPFSLVHSLKSILWNQLVLLMQFV
jgi:hypothetical protein